MARFYYSMYAICCENCKAVKRSVKVLFKEERLIVYLLRGRRSKAVKTLLRCA